MKIKLTLAVVLLTLIVSCKKKDDTVICNLSTTTIAKTYRITSVKYKANTATPEVEVFTNSMYFDPCDRDNTFTFNTNGTYTLTDAGVVCSPSSSDTGTWSLSGTTLIMDSTPGTVENFNCTSFQYVETDTSIPGFKVTITNNTI